jgi:hypothetical protein
MPAQGLLRQLKGIPEEVGRHLIQGTRGQGVSRIPGLAEFIVDKIGFKSVSKNSKCIYWPGSSGEHAEALAKRSLIGFGAYSRLARRSAGATTLPYLLISQHSRLPGSRIHRRKPIY